MQETKYHQFIIKTDVRQKANMTIWLSKYQYSISVWLFQTLVTFAFPFGKNKNKKQLFNWKLQDRKFCTRSKMFPMQILFMFKLC